MVENVVADHALPARIDGDQSHAVLVGRHGAKARDLGHYHHLAARGVERDIAKYFRRRSMLLYPSQPRRQYGCPCTVPSVVSSMYCPSATQTRVVRMS
jgi:hypothetical protein